MFQVILNTFFDVADLRRLEMVQFPNRVQELDTVLARYAGTRPFAAPFFHLAL